MLLLLQLELAVLPTECLGPRCRDAVVSPWRSQRKAKSTPTARSQERSSGHFYLRLWARSGGGAAQLLVA